MNQPSQEKRSGASGVDPGAVIVQPLGCVKCRYDLRGLSVAGGTCPECGTSVGESVLAVVDPKAGRLRRLRDPKRVGDALLWITFCLTGGMILLFVRPAAVRFDGIVGSGLAAPLPAWLPLAAAGLFFAALAGVVHLAPPRRQEPTIGRDLRLLAVGLTAAALVSAGGWAFGLFESGAPAGSVRRYVPPWVWVVIPLSMAGALIMLGLRGVLRVIGERSRVYRMASGGRQRMIDLIGALGGAIVGAALLGWGVANKSPVEWIGVVILWISMLMLAVGMAYLVVNAIWIRRSLRKPPPRLHDLIGAPDRLPTPYRPTVLERPPAPPAPPEPPAADAPPE